MTLAHATVPVWRFGRPQGFPQVHRAKHASYRETIGTTTHIGLRDKVLVVSRDKVLVNGVTKCSWKTPFFHRHFRILPFAADCGNGYLIWTRRRDTGGGLLNNRMPFSLTAKPASR